jgi:Co/Zn/Cd efflux system component
MFEKMKGQWGYRASEELSYSENLQRSLQYSTLLTCYSLLILLAIVSFLLRLMAGDPVSGNIMLLVALALLVFAACVCFLFSNG